MEIKKKKIEDIVKNHKLWLLDNKNGECANFSNLDLEGVNFSNLDLSKANFMRANLKGANFHACILVDCCFAGANLQDVDFSFACLSNTCFTLANLLGVDFCVSNIINPTFWLTKGVFVFNGLETIPSYAVVHRKKMMIQVEYYFWGTINEFKKHRLAKFYQPQIIYLEALEKQYCNL